MAAAKIPFQIALKTHRCCDPLCPELLFYLDIYSLESDAMTETAESCVASPNTAGRSGSLLPSAMLPGELEISQLSDIWQFRSVFFEFDAKKDSHHEGMRALFFWLKMAFCCFFA